MFILFQQCSTVNIYKYKGKYVLKEFLMLLMDRNFNPFATCILNKQGHIINGNTVNSPLTDTLVSGQLYLRTAF